MGSGEVHYRDREKPCQQLFQIGARNFWNRPGLRSKATRLFQIPDPNFWNWPGLSSKPENMVSPCRLVSMSVERAPGRTWLSGWRTSKYPNLNKIWRVAWRTVEYMVLAAIDGANVRRHAVAPCFVLSRCAWWPVPLYRRHCGPRLVNVRTWRRGFSVSSVLHLRRYDENRLTGFFLVA